MNMQVDKLEGVTVVRVKEEKLVYPLLGSFFAKISQLIEGGARNVLIDLSKVMYVDSATIGCLMDIYRLLAERSGSLKLVGLQERVEAMVSMTGLHNLVEIYREEKSAIDSF